VARPKFVQVSATKSGTNLIVCFQESGLGNNVTVTIEARATATAEYECRTKSEKNPSDPKKSTVITDVQASGEFTSDQNGMVRGCLTLSPPEPDIACPPGQNLVLLGVTYTNVSVVDTTNNVSRSIRGTF
jgi:hypothetical protein